MNIESGQFLRFQIPVRTRQLWLTPAWAVLCGMVASGAFLWTGRDVLIALLAVVIADGMWATQWWGLVETDWRQLFADWKTIPVEHADRSLALRGSPADRSQHGLARLRVWWRTIGREQAGMPLFSAFFALALGVLLSAVISWQAVALTFIAFAVTQIAVIMQLQGRSPRWLQGFVTVGLAWVLGHAAFGALTLLSVVAAVLFSWSFATLLALAQGAVSRRWLLPQVILLIILVWLQQPIAALAALTLLAAQALLATVLQSQDFARAAQWWLMLAMLVAALGLR